MSLSDALGALKSNKGDHTETFRQIFSDRSRYDDLRQVLEAVSSAPASVLESPQHASKYVKLIVTITEHRSHLEHLKCKDWELLSTFLVSAVQRFCSSYTSFELVKISNDAFRGLSLLVSATESVQVEFFPALLDCCRNFIESLSSRENSCTPYIMRILRYMIQFGFEPAESLGTRLLKLGKPKNPLLKYEMFVFACYSPQSVSVLRALNPVAIEPHEIEFNVHSDLGHIFNSFRPSSEADLTRFVAAVAFAVATFDGPTAKRAASDTGNHDFDEMLSALKASPCTPYDTLGATSSTATFWRFVALAKNHSREDPGQNQDSITHLNSMRLMRMCQDNLENSGAGYCLSQLIRELVRPDKISAEIVNQILALLDFLTAQESLCLNSGMLHLISSMADIRILDSGFQRRKKQSLQKLLQEQLRKCCVLSSEFFGCGCEPAYLQQDVFDDLRAINRFLALRDAQRAWDPSVLDPPCLAGVDLVSDFPLAMESEAACSGPLRDMLWNLACRAHTGAPLGEYCVTTPITEVDKQAVVWFARLALRFNWRREICDRALKLIGSPPGRTMEIDTAISLLSKPARAVALVLDDSPASAVRHEAMTGADLRALQPFLNSYKFQASPRIILGMLRLILSGDSLRYSAEGQKLLTFLKSQTTGSSQCSNVSKLLRQYEATAEDSFDLAVKVYRGLISYSNAVTMEFNHVDGLASSVVSKWASIAKTSPGVFVNALATPLLLANAEQCESILRSLGASEQTLVKIAGLSRNMATLDPLDASGLIQQLFLDCSVLTTLKEKEDVIRYCQEKYVARIDSEEVSESFWSYACALVRVANSEHLRLIIKELFMRISEPSLNTLVCLFSAGLPFSFVKARIDALDSPGVFRLLKTANILDIPRVLVLLKHSNFETHNYVFAELVLLVAQPGQLDLVVDKDPHFSEEDASMLWNWSDKLGLMKLDQKTSPWIAFLAKLRCAKHSQIEEGDFVQMLKTTYQTLPFSKKWYLNAFIHELGTAKFKLPLVPPVPATVAQFNTPAMGTMLSTVHKKAGAVLQAVLSYWKLVPLGTCVLQRVPELINVIPQLVSNLRSVPAEVVYLIESCLDDSSTRQFGLSVIERYVEVNKIVFCDVEKILGACVMAEDRFVTLGFLVTELQWNGRKTFRESCLDYFYGKLPDPGFRNALRKSTDIFHISTGSRWQQLQFDLVKDEVTNRSPQPSFGAAGLWHLACRDTAYNLYDCEKAWWLQEWDDVDFTQPTGTLFGQATLLEDPEYGVLIRFLKNQIDTDQAYAQLYICNPVFCDILADIILPELQSGSNEIVRRGREIRAGMDNERLAKELRSSCELLRTAKDVYGALEYSMKLSCLASSPGASAAVTLAAKIQSAHTTWSLKKPETAIRMLKSAIESTETWLPNENCTLANWSYLARQENDDTIVRYFERAIEISDTKSEEFIHHSFARFCESRYRDENFKASISDSWRVIQSEEQQLKLLKEIILSHEGSRDSNLESKYGQTKRMLESEKENYGDLQNKKQRLITQCIKSYLLSMHSGDSYEQDMARFISVWLESYDDKAVNRMVNEGVLNGPPTRKYLPWMNQLTSRLSRRDPNHQGGFQNPLHALIAKACREHPHHTVWQLLNILRRKHDASGAEMKEAADSIIRSCLFDTPVIKSIVEFADNMCSFSQKLAVRKSRPHLKREMPTWWLKHLPKLHLPIPTVTISPRNDRDYSSVPYITHVDREFDVAGGLSAPVIITMLDSLGRTHRMLLKSSKKDDLRQDAIMQQVFSTVNALLRSGSNLKVRTYNVVPLGDTFGAIEFVKGTRSLIEVLEPLHHDYGGPDEYPRQSAVSMLNQKRDSSRATRLEFFTKVMRHTEPEMRHFWPRNCSSLEDWLRSQTSWSRSNGVMSIVGYIIGLGDRHCSNLLLDTLTGEVVHIDFGIAFDQGRMLHVPETVPFRLTRDMVDGMGVQGVTGVYNYAANETLRAVCAEQDIILSVLEVLKLDSLYSWKLPLQRSRENTADHSESNRQAEQSQAEVALHSVRHKLNLQMSCEAVVRDLVSQATDVKNLAQIYPGWCPFY